LAVFFLSDDVSSALVTVDGDAIRKYWLYHLLQIHPEKMDHLRFHCPDLPTHLQVLYLLLELLLFLHSLELKIPEQKLPVDLQPA